MMISMREGIHPGCFLSLHWLNLGMMRYVWDMMQDTPGFEVFVSLPPSLSSSAPPFPPLSPRSFAGQVLATGCSKDPRVYRLCLQRNSKYGQ